MKKRPFFMAIASIIVLVSCSSKPQPDAANNAGTTDMKLSAEQRYAATAGQVAPDVCRVIATVLEIAPIAVMEDSTAPCAQAPCRATLQISRIVGTGSAFKAPVLPGASVSVHFAYTTAGTTELFPDKTPALPGVTAGDEIMVDLNAVKPVMGSSQKSEISYTVYDYIIQ